MYWLKVSAAYAYATTLFALFSFDFSYLPLSSFKFIISSYDIKIRRNFFMNLFSHIYLKRAVLLLLPIMPVSSPVIASSMGTYDQPPESQLPTNPFIKYLYNAPLIVAIVGLFLCYIAILSGRRVNLMLLTLYLLFIAFMTLMFRENRTGETNLQLFWSYRQLLYNDYLRREIFNNIWLFIPLGTILYRLYPRISVIFFVLLISGLIEISQYVFGIGLFELDDLISNCLGGMIGILIGRYFSHFNH